jgi:protein subunit release factor A
MLDKKLLFAVFALKTNLTAKSAKSEDAKRRKGRRIIIRTGERSES